MSMQLVTQEMRGFSSRCGSSGGSCAAKTLPVNVPLVAVLFDTGRRVGLFWSVNAFKETICVVILIGHGREGFCLMKLAKGTASFACATLQSWSQFRSGTCLGGGSIADSVLWPRRTDVGLS